MDQEYVYSAGQEEKRKLAQAQIPDPNQIKVKTPTFWKVFCIKHCTSQVE